MKTTSPPPTVSSTVTCVEVAVLVLQPMLTLQNAPLRIVHPFGVVVRLPVLTGGTPDTITESR
jgi:hypothetical protein